MQIKTWEGIYPQFFAWDDSELAQDETGTGTNRIIYNSVLCIAESTGITLQSKYLNPVTFKNVSYGEIKCPFAGGGVTFYSLDTAVTHQSQGGGLSLFASFLVGKFDNSVQVVVAKNRPLDPYEMPFYQHHNGIIDNRITGRPSTDNGHYVLAEFYATKPHQKTTYKPFFFKIVSAGVGSADCMVIGYEVPVPPNQMKLNNTNLRIPFSSLHPDPKFTPTVYKWDSNLAEFHAHTEQLEESVRREGLTVLDMYGSKHPHNNPETPIQYERLWVR
eukprot:TRINITY_DN32137_c0_g1_i1.p1 TRINITY_DN32137_c0_g1~~TRINITY_DN32137_c0_g1_i1.p1  ORF type:complete len:274 (-),score=43.76 TRINITY_DN32137_c0_g1_i1:169-990(-)